MKRFWWLPLCVLACTLARDARRAQACGGPSVVAPEVVAPPHLLGYDMDSELPRTEERFLYPYLLAHPKEAQRLWQFAYEGALDAPALNEQPYLRANADKHPDLARKEAQKLLDEWYALPPVPAAAQREVAFRAAELLEQAGSSASPTQQFVGLVAHFTSQVPNGWQRGVKSLVPAAFWSQELANAQAWIDANPSHPLRDLALLWQVRVHYFAGDSDAAWALLFDLYPRRRTRALAEMRYLIQQGTPPSAAQLDSLTDPLLAASLVNQENATPARWNRYWRLSQQTHHKLEALALQERLLQALVPRSDAALPSLFPKRAERPSQYWGKVRGLLLLRHGQLTAARDQLLRISSDPEQATLLAHCFLSLGDPVEAARTPQLDEVDANYLIQVLTPPAQLLALSTDSNPRIGAAAGAALAADQIRRGDFLGAARWYKSVDASQAEDLEEMAKLQKQGDELGLARALRARGKDLGVGMQSDYYRGFSLRYAQLEPDSPEAKQLAAYFEASFGSFQALRHFVPWLEAHTNDPKARDVLDEADAAYVALQSFGGWSDLFWVRHLTNHDLAVRLRKVGKLLRLKAASPRGFGH